MLWTWFAGVFDIATKHAQAVLAVWLPRHHRTWQAAVPFTPSSAAWGTLAGLVFAALTAIGAFVIGYMVQASSQQSPEAVNQ